MPGEESIEPTSAERIGQQEAFEQENEIIFRHAAEYGNMSAERTRMNPELRKPWEQYRKAGLFMAQVYSADIGYYAASYDPDKLNFDSPRQDINHDAYTYEGTRPSDTLSNRIFQDEEIIESVSLRPLMTSDIEKVPVYEEQTEGWFKKKKVKVDTGRTTTKKIGEHPTPFGAVVPKASPKAAELPAARLTYYVHSQDGLRANGTHDGYNFRDRQAQPGHLDEAMQTTIHANDLPTKAANIDARAQDIMKLDEATKEELNYRTGKRGQERASHIAVSVVLPAARARELQEYFKQHPNQVRPFFISGGLERMDLHTKPQYDIIDQLNRPIRFQEKNPDQTINNMKTEDITPGAQITARKRALAPPPPPKPKPKQRLKTPPPPPPPKPKKSRSKYEKHPMMPDPPPPPKPKKRKS